MRASRTVSTIAWARECPSLTWRSTSSATVRFSPRAYGLYHEHGSTRHVSIADAQKVRCVFNNVPAGDLHLRGDRQLSRPIAWRLIEAGFDVRLVSSMALARTREALHNGWDKNDPRDAQVILHMLRIGATQRYHDPLRAGINDVQELSKTHEAIAKAKTEIQHRILTHYLPLYFPEIERF